MEIHCKIHLVHVMGTRMIAQGTDVLSRGNLDEGVCPAGASWAEDLARHMATSWGSILIARRLS
eukprot:8112519-Ditylum_brightwellii.AAC.2